MRLNLIIQRHGLPITRILWSTSPPSVPGQPRPSSYAPASSSVIASTRTPNAAFANGYTISQLLEDVNEVIPLETELDEDAANGTGYGACGSWGLEDYIVEVGGFECLHFMDAEGLLRDGDEVVIRALQTSDVRQRRLAGRHQISTDGRHLIDGVPFGKAYLKRPTSSRPTIAIPPKKRRRTAPTLSSWDDIDDIERDDEEWAPLGYEPEPRALHPDKAALVRQDVDEADEDAQVSEGDADASEPGSENEHEDEDEEEGEEEDLQQELSGLREDMELSDVNDGTNGEQDTSKVGYSLRSRARSRPERSEKSPVSERDRTPPQPVGIVSKPSFAPRALRLKSGANAPRKPSSVAPNKLQSPKSDGSPRESKVVRFQDQRKDQMGPPEPQRLSVEKEPSAAQVPARDGEKEEELDEASSSSSVSDDTSSDEENTRAEESSESEPTEESDTTETTSESEEETSESEDDSSSESDVSDEEATFGKQQPKTSAPGDGSSRTKKTNRRNKARRKLAKLKELGALPLQADFAAMRDWESVNGGWYIPPESKLSEAENIAVEKPSGKTRDQVEFEEKRQNLLRQLESGGIDIDGVSEEEDHAAHPPSRAEEARISAKATEQAEPRPTEEAANEVEPEPVRKSTLDVESSRRLLFGSLGVKTPRTKEDEEATRQKLAKRAENLQSQKQPRQPYPIPLESESDPDENWQDKLVVKATECVFDDIELSAPPFPFEQRWDDEAINAIRKRKGLGKKRRRRRRAQVHEEDWGEEYEANGDYENGDIQLNYDDENNDEPMGDGIEVSQIQEENPVNPTEDLPDLPDDLSTVPDLVESEVKPSSIIAYKQLEMSKATNWQPKVSEYQVAEVHEILDGGVVNVRLAKRHWVQPEDNAGEEDAPREYSGFEMPGFEDDETADDGFREVSFGELIEPKLLRQAARVEADATEPQDAQGAIISYDSQDSVEKLPSVAVEIDNCPQSVIGDSRSVSAERQGVERSPGETRTESETEWPTENMKGNSHDSAHNAGSDAIRSPMFAGFGTSPIENADGGERHDTSEHQEVERSTEETRVKSEVGRPTDNTKESSNSHDNAQDPGSDAMRSPTFVGFEASPMEDADGAQQHVDIDGLDPVQPQIDGAGDDRPNTPRGNDNCPVQPLPSSPMPSYTPGGNDDGNQFQNLPSSPIPSEHLPKTTDHGRRLRVDSSAGSTGSFDRLLEMFNIKRSDRGSSPVTTGEVEEDEGRPESQHSRSPSPDSFIPNPFYHIDKAREEQEERGESNERRSPTPQKLKKESQAERVRSRDATPEIPSTPQPEPSPSHEQSEPSAFLDLSTPPSQRGRSQTRKSDTPPFPTQTSEVVDLTESPAVSPDRANDPDYTDPSPLPRGPGWVQKNEPPRRKQTRSSGRMQTMKEVSISPPQVKRGPLRRRF